jgi:hypothetical protein
MPQSLSDPIKYSDKTIHWNYGDNTPNNLANLEKITKWWTSLDGKSVTIRCITGGQKDKSTGEWKLIEEKPIETIEIQNPQLTDDVLIFNGSSKISRIDKIDYLVFDPIQNQLVVNLRWIQITQQNPDIQHQVGFVQDKQYVFTLQ